MNISFYVYDYYNNYIFNILILLVVYLNVLFSVKKIKL
jgi:hypothetical protein